MKRISQFLPLIAWTVLVVSAPATADKPQRPNGNQGQGQGQGKAAVCGGLAGLTCPQGKVCFSTDAFPDAAGVCLSAAQVEAGRNRCAAVRCAAPECAEGQQVLVTPETCCGSCIPAPKGRGQGATGGQGAGDRCKTAAECDARDLPHIQCVGSWSCDQGRCKFNCDAGSAPTR